MRLLFWTVATATLLCDPAVGATAASEGWSRPYPSEARRTLSPGHTTYYIDPAEGSDANSGLERRAPWRSFGRVNKLMLSAGDRVEVISPGEFHGSLVLRGIGTKEAPIVVRFAPGRYDFHPDKAFRHTYQISNSNGDPDTPKAVGILLGGARHVRLTGPGARLVYRGKMIEICLDGCRDVVVSDLELDYHRPTVSEFTVTAVEPDYADLDIHEDSHYAIDDGRITWQGEGWSYRTGLAQELDPRTNETWRRRDPLDGLRLEELPGGGVRAHGPHNMTAGRIYQLRDTHRDCVGVFMQYSRDITWRNVTFRYLHGLGLVSQFCQDLTFDSIVVAPDKASGRTTAAWADCLQVSGCRGRVLVRDCTFSGTHDDAINIHGTHLRVVEQLGDREIKVRFMHKQTFGFPAFNTGDQVEFVRWDSLETYGPNGVERAKLISPREMLITLAKPVPKELRENDCLENVTWTPEVEIRGCRVSRVPTRGFLITTRRKVLVEDNLFLKTRMSAILVENDASGWYESGCVRNMTIRGNRFVRCGEPVVNVNPRNRVPNPAVHRNIRIEDNQFILRGSTSVRAKSTTGLEVVGNTIYADRESSGGTTIQTTDCGDVRIKGNRQLPLSEAPPKGVTN